MNLLQGAACLVVAGGAVFFFARPGPADEYPLPMAEVYHRLAAVSVAYNPAGADPAAFGGHSVVPGGNGSDQVVWTVGHSAPVDCAIALSPLAADKTKVAVSCNLPASQLAQLASAGIKPDGGMNGPMLDATRNDVIEKIDATLTGQPFDPAKTGALALRWPADVVHHAGIGEAMGQQVGTAIKMDVEMERERQREDAARASGQTYGAADTSGVPRAAWTPPAQPGDANPWGKGH